MPRVLGVGEILDEWTAWRMECVKRRVYFQLQKKKDRLHLLKGLKKILLDIDKAIAIIRGTESDAEVVPNLMIGFGIDQIQAEFVAEIKLRNINQEYILKRLEDVESLEAEIADLTDLLKSDRRIRDVIIKELKTVADKYGKDRFTTLVYEHQLVEEEPEEEIPDYPVTMFVSKGGYLKKITPQSLRMSGEQKFKEGDSLSFSRETSNRAELLVFTDKAQVYKTRLSEFEDTKASVLGEFLPSKLDMDEGESVLAVCLPGDYKGNMLFVFENGKVAKVDLAEYATKSNRRKLTGAYSDKSPVKGIFLVTDEGAQIVIYATDGRALIFSASQLTAKTTRSTLGVAVMSLKKNKLVERAALVEESGIGSPARYRSRSLPAAGALLKGEDAGQLELF
jgi:DNA gyrase subunit A